MRGPVQLMIDGGRIVGVEFPGPVATDVDLIDLGEATLLPGLIDAHTHLTWNARPDAVVRVSADDDETLLDQARRSAAAALAVGITTVRDLGDRNYLTLALRDQLRDSPAAGPEVVASGPPITTPHGHCAFLGGEADRDEELRVAVRTRVERGVDVIKVMATGGNMTPGAPPPHQSQYDRRQLQVLAEAAHDAGIPIAAHAHGATGATDAVLAGFDTIEHGGFWTAAGAQAPDGAVDEIIRRGIVVVATPAARGLPDPGQLPPLVAARLRAIAAVMATLRDRGVPVAYASDAGIGPGKEHDVLAHSLPAAIAAGWTPATALEAMTSIAASACGLGERKGRIAAGFDADLLAVARNPVDDPTSLSDTVAVFRAGVRVSD